MADIIQDPAETVIPAPSEPPVTPPEDAPLSEHIAQFHEEPQPDEEPAEKPKRHRSSKNFARPEDVPRIKELTKQVQEWKEKYEAVAPKAEAKPEPPRYTPPEPPRVSTFDEKEPTLDDPKYAGTSDPYSAWQRDLARYDRKKEAFEASQAQTSAEQQQQTKAFQEAVQQRAATYGQKLSAYLTEHPDHRQAFEQMPNVSNPLLIETVWALEDGPSVVYNLLRQPAFLSELHLLTEGKPVSDANVALTTQWLRARLQAESTGAAVRESSPSPPAPRPPTPVRTRPMPPTDGPPSDDASLMEHQRYYKTAR